jgi:hypothetical protein
MLNASRSCRHLAIWCTLTELQLSAADVFRLRMNPMDFNEISTLEKLFGMDPAQPLFYVKVKSKVVPALK